MNFKIAYNYENIYEMIINKIHLSTIKTKKFKIEELFINNS